MGGHRHSTLHKLSAHQSSLVSDKFGSFFCSLFFAHIGTRRWTDKKLPFFTKFFLSCSSRQYRQGGPVIMFHYGHLKTKIKVASCHQREIWWNHRPSHSGFYPPLAAWHTNPPLFSRLPFLLSRLAPIATGTLKRVRLLINESLKSFSLWEIKSKETSQWKEEGEKKKSGNAIIEIEERRETKDEKER